MREASSSLVAWTAVYSAQQPKESLLCLFSNVFTVCVYAAFVVLEVFHVRNFTGQKILDDGNFGANFVDALIFEVVIFDMCPDVGEWANAAWKLQKKWQNGASLSSNLKLVPCRDDT